MINRFAFVLISSLLTAGCAVDSGATFESRGALAPGSTGSRLYAGLDRYHFPITTDSPDAQRWFDQGLQLIYGFNHGEAIRSFQEAAARDPEAAMPWWGIAYSYGMNINDAIMTPERWQAATEAVNEAQSRLAGVTELERALIEALSVRYTWPAPEAQKPFDEAYMVAMAEVYAQFNDNPDVGVMYAEAIMNLQPWSYWEVDGTPKGNTELFVDVLEHVLALEPDHPEACHLYIHALEAGPAPERAEAAADRLLNRIPGAGHLVHMPSHLYARVGRYSDAADANVQAIAADRIFLANGTEPGMYWIYFAHNLHFLAFASMMEGRYEPAIEAARELDGAIPEEALRQFAFLIEGITPTTYHVQIRFGKWEDILLNPLPADFRLVSRAVHYYARAIALSALGRTSEARIEVAKFETAVAEVPEEWWIFNNHVYDVMPIARAMLEGELAFREGRLDDAWAALRRGIAAEDRLVYDEPPAWMLPVRHAMGALLMSAGEFAEAEQLYREDQEIHPGNGWSLLGLQLALAAQNRTDEAAQITPRLDMAWKRLNVRPTSSCFCEPGPAAAR